MSDLASLTSQLGDNLAQLAQLDELLLADPDNAELRAIREDIAQVIALTRELQQAAGQLPQEEAKQLEQTVGATTNHDAPSSSTVTETQTAASSMGGYNAPVPAAAASSSSSAAVIASSISLPPFAASSSSSASSALLPINGVYPPGARVMALYPKDGKYYISRIDRVDTGADEYTVTYLEYNQVGTIGFDSVRPWIHATPEQLRIANTPVKALFPEDGLFYNASLEGPSGSVPGYYAIKFGHLGGKKKRVVDVPLYDIVINERFMDAKTMQFTSAASANAKASAQLSEEMPVPEYLVVQPTDSDAIKTQKLKKLKKLRYEHKKAFEEQETNKRKSSWQDFKAGKSQPSKKSKLYHAPGLAALQKQSMFSTSDSVDAVVGVTGSGRGMTDHQTVKKHVFSTQP